MGNRTDIKQYDVELQADTMMFNSMFNSVFNIMFNRYTVLIVSCLTVCLTASSAYAEFYQAYGRTSIYVDQLNNNALYWSTVVKIKRKSDGFYLNCFPADTAKWDKVFNGDMTDINITTQGGVNLIFKDYPITDAGYLDAAMGMLNTVHRIGSWLQKNGHQVELYFMPINLIDYLNVPHYLPSVQFSTDLLDTVRQNKVIANRALLAEHCGVYPIADCMIAVNSLRTTCGTTAYFEFPDSFGDGSFSFRDKSISDFVYISNETDFGYWRYGSVPKGLYEIKVYYPASPETMTTAFYFVWINGKTFTRTLDMAVMPPNTWHSIGYFDLRDATNAISVGMTKQTPDNKFVVYDAIRVIRLK